MGDEGRRGAGGEARPRVVFDLRDLARVPGGIASHRVTIQVLGPESPPVLPDQRR